MSEQTRHYENNVIKQCFLSPDVLSHCITRSAGHNIFTQTGPRMTWEAYRACFNNEVNVSLSSVSDVFKATITEDDSALERTIEIFKDIISEVYQEEREWKYHFHYIHETWRLRKILELKRYIEHNIQSQTSQQISEALIDELTDITAGEIETRSFRSSVKSAMTDIREIKSGKKSNIIFTGIKEIDTTGIFQPTKEVLVAAVKKCGKTRWIANIIDKMCQHPENTDIAIQWYTLEMRAEEIIRLFISMKCRVDDYQMTSNDELPDYLMEAMDMAESLITRYPIEFIDSPVNIYNIANMFGAFAKKHKDKRKIMIIDNLGMIKPHIENQITFEDDIARHIKNLRDTHKALIIPIHHMTKETESRLNKDNGYEPRPNHMRGSSRIMDFTNSMVILHRPDLYQDLVDDAVKENRADDINGLFIANVALNRGGPTRRIIMNHEIGYSLFTERK